MPGNRQPRNTDRLAMLLDRLAMLMLMQHTRPLFSQLLHHAQIVEYMTTVQLDRWGTVQILDPANVAVVLALDVVLTTQARRVYAWQASMLIVADDTATVVATFMGMSACDRFLVLTIGCRTNIDMRRYELLAAAADHVLSRNRALAEAAMARLQVRLVLCARHSQVIRCCHATGAKLQRAIATSESKLLAMLQSLCRQSSTINALLLRRPSIISLDRSSMY
jgi:hypothetical protein